jgi:type IV secretory pathway TrbD component
VALDQHRVHRSLLRPALFMGVERKLFFTAATCGIPIVGYGSLSLRSLFILAAYCTLAYILCTRLTAKDHHLIGLLFANVRYRDHYNPLPTSQIVGLRPTPRS